MTDFLTSVWVETAFQKYLSVLLIYILLNPNMTNMLFLPTESLLNQKINKDQEVKKFLLSKEALRCQTNSPCQYQKKRFGNSIEQNDVEM